MQQGIAHVHGAAFTHRHVVGRVEAGGADVAPGASGAPGELGAEGVAVVLDEPEVVGVAEGLDGGEIEWIA